MVGLKQKLNHRGTGLLKLSESSHRLSDCIIPKLIFINRLQVLAATIAVSSAQLVTYPNGAVVPAETPEVAAARLAHAQAGGAIAYAAGYPYAAYHPYAVGVPGALVGHANGAVVPVDTAEVYAAKVDHAAAGGAIHPVGAYAAYWPYYAGLVAHPNGAVVPVEPADVQAARAEHLAAHTSA